MPYANLLTERKGHTGIIKLNRPPYHAMEHTMLFDLGLAMDEMIADADVRVIIITGDGDKMFSRGWDSVATMAEPMVIPFIGVLGNRVFTKIERSPKPVIAAINGIALGGGCELAAACHLRVMEDRPRVWIGQEETKLGVVPGWGGSLRLPRIIGRARALEMLLTYKKVKAQEAYSWGLVNKVSKPGESMKDALNLAANIGETHVPALKAAIDAIILGMDTDMASAEIIVENEGTPLWSIEAVLNILNKAAEIGEDKWYESDYDCGFAKMD